jgi:hypothetical protein
MTQTEQQIDFMNECIDDTLDQIEAEEKAKLTKERITKYLRSMGFND